MVKNRINNTGLKVFNECSESMGMKDSENVGGESFKGEMERDVLVVGNLEPLGAGDSMEELNKFVGDEVFFEK